MDCPGCSVEMANLEGEELTLHKCGDCVGVWIDAADLNRVLLRHNLPGLESLGGKLNSEAPTGQCPECKVDLVSVDGGDRNHHPLHYDTCESCGGIFLEAEFQEATDLGAITEEMVSFFQAFSGKSKKQAKAG